jgi:hypothetical protein
VPEEEKKDVKVDKENDSPNTATGRPLWSTQADDAPALELSASSLSSTTLSGGLGLEQTWVEV